MRWKNSLSLCIFDLIFLFINILIIICFQISIYKYLKCFVHFNVCFLPLCFNKYTYQIEQHVFTHGISSMQPYVDETPVHSCDISMTNCVRCASMIRESINFKWEYYIFLSTEITRKIYPDVFRLLCSKLFRKITLESQSLCMTNMNK